MTEVAQKENKVGVSADEGCVRKIAGTGWPQNQPTREPGGLPQNRELSIRTRSPFRGCVPLKARVDAVCKAVRVKIQLSSALLQVR